MAEEEEMKVLAIILGILSAVIILCLLAFSFIYESDYRQLKELDKCLTAPCLSRGIKYKGYDKNTEI